MERPKEKPGAGGAGPLNRAFSHDRHIQKYSESGPFGQDTTVHELERARSALAYTDPHNHDNWLKSGMALKAEFGDEGWSVFDEWSRQAENYDARENRSRWQSFKPGGGITIASLYKRARDNGWRDDDTFCVPDPEELAARARKRALVASNAEETRDAKAAEAARKSRVLRSMAGTAIVDNPYCRRKGIEPPATLLEINAEKTTATLGYAPSAKGGPLEGSLLVVPIKVADELSSLQLIDGAGRKHFLAGGVIAGGSWATQALPDGDGAGLEIHVGEGVATVLSARQAVPGVLGVSAMMNSNIPKVARQLQERWPRADIVILADLDKQTGEPDKHAVAAASQVGGRLAVPLFTDGPAADRKDFNDLAREHGPEAVRQAIEAATLPSTNQRAAAGAVQNAKGATGAWPSPQALMPAIDPEPYPLDALPDNIRQAVEEVEGYVQAPLALVASSAISALSLTCQPLIDVRRDERLLGPVSLNLLSIADSGERKTTLDSLFNAPLRDWQQLRATEIKPKIDAFKSAHAAWIAECEGVKSAIKEAAKKAKRTDELNARLAKLTESEPRGPSVPSLFLGDETPENLAWRLSKQWPSAGLISSEAGVVFGGHAMSAEKVLGYLSLLNIIWDGGELPVGRKTSQSFTVRGVRLTCGLQVQQAALLDFIKRSGTLARGAGFWARFLISWPASTIGTRLYREPGPMPSLEAYQSRLAALLKLPVPLRDDGTLKPAIADLDVDAKAAFVAYYDAIEQDLGIGGELHNVRDVAAKSAENAARLAALFQAFETDLTNEGLRVTADNFHRASRIAAWHLSEACRFFGELAMPDDIADAALLDTWLIQECSTKSCPAVRKNHVRQCGPGRLRDGKRLDAALKILADLDRVRIPPNRAKMLEINPALIGGRT